MVAPLVEAQRCRLEGRGFDVPSGCTVALRSFGKFGSLNHVEHLGPVQAYTGIALPFFLTINDFGQQLRNT